MLPWKGTRIAMKHASLGLATSEEICVYGASRLPVRGPRNPLDAPYVAFIGGTETYGRFIPHPFPALIDNMLGINAVNLGCVNAGVDAYWRDDVLMRLCQGAQAVVIQVVGAQNLSNRFYTVHPRRNDRFIAASEHLVDLYPEVDFTRYSFTRHLLGDLLAIDPGRFARVREELATAWTCRMRSMIQRVDRPVVLLWFADHLPNDLGHQDLDQGRRPLFVTRAMLDEVAELARDLIIVCPDRQTLDEGTVGMQFAPAEAAVARVMLGIGAHHQAAAALGPALAELVASNENGRAVSGTPVAVIR